VSITLVTPGPAGGGDIYLRAVDLPNSSSICAGPDCLGDLTDVASSGCGAFCFDVRIFEDACVPGHPSCSLGYQPFAPYFAIDYKFGEPGELRAIFRASFEITDSAGPNPGWHSICAPIELLNNGQLPSNADGFWEMTRGDSSNWDFLLANFTKIWFPVDIIPNPGEIFGYDNFCLRDDVCPQGQIPTLTEWGMIIFCVLLFGWMTWVVVRRRRMVTVGI